MANKTENNEAKNTQRADGKTEGVTYEQAVEQGFIGVKTDPAPNEDYTVQGVLKARNAAK